MSKYFEVKMIDALNEVKDFINQFNQNKDEDFDIDSIRIEFNKTYKLTNLNQLGTWVKVNKNDKRIMNHITTSYYNIKVTSVKRLEKYNIYYYNLPDPPKYSKAVMVIFGLKQYHKEVQPEKIICKILNIMKDISNLDVCKDLKYKPNIENLKKYFKLKQYVEPNTKVPTDTYYINDTKDITTLLKKVVIYNKAKKNNLKNTLWRIEANISLSNIKDKESAIWLSLNYFKDEIIKHIEV